jgi:hypothetical protein
MEGSPAVAELLTPMHYVRLTLVAEDVPESAGTVPEGE